MTRAPQHPAGYLALLAGSRPAGAPLSPRSPLVPRERGAVSTVQGVPLALSSQPPLPHRGFPGVRLPVPSHGPMSFPLQLSESG